MEIFLIIFIIFKLRFELKNVINQILKGKKNKLIYNFEEIVLKNNKKKKK